MIDRERILREFDTHLRDLVPEVREKAIQYAVELLSQEEISAEEAIKLSIMRAEEWYLSRQG